MSDFSTEPIDPAEPSDALPPSNAIHTSSGDAQADAGEAFASEPVGSGSPTDATDATDPAEPPPHEVEGAVPPGYDWPTHGGYLGCLVGTIAACLVTGFLGANLFSYLYIARGWPFPVFALLTLALFIAAVVGFGRLGWQLGRRFYRYYPQPRPTWGEDDSAAAELAPVRQKRSKANEQSTLAGESVRDEGERSHAPTMHVPTMEAHLAAQSGQREGLVEGRQRQDDGRDGGHETSDQAENSNQEPQRS